MAFNFSAIRLDRLIDPEPLQARAHHSAHKQRSPVATSTRLSRSKKIAANHQGRAHKGSGLSAE
jgi:hypothetical protein